MERLYDEWGIRVMVLLSLLWQVLLQLLGNRRKFSRSVWLRIVVWCSYVSADPVTTLALGMISTKLVCIKDLSRLGGETKLNVLWAPCLLVLLGGPDSITSYSVEDNELWLRHVLGLVAQTSLACYICFLARAADCPSYLSLVLLVVGVVKYGERVWVLWQVSFDKLRNAQLDSTFWDWTMVESFEGNELPEGYVLFKIFKHIFLNQKLDRFDRKSTMQMFDGITLQKAFKIIEIELGFIYDLLHTKAKTTYTGWGLCRRLMTSTISCVVLAVFSWFVNRTSPDDNYPRVDVALTVVLLATNILSEIYWLCMLLSSDWAEVVWIMNHKSWFSKLWTSNQNVVRNTLLQHCQQPRWSNSTGQLSFFTLFSYADERLLKRLHLHDTVGPYYYAQHREVTDYIKCQILMMIENVVKKQNGKIEEILAKNKKTEENGEQEQPLDDSCPPSSSKSHNITLGERSRDKKQLFPNYRELLKYVCTDIHPDYICLDDEFREEYDFADCVTIWHVATELCYSCDHDNSSPHSDERDAAMLLSRYMFYILVRYPSMLQTVDRNVKLKYFRDELQLKNRAWVVGIKNAKKLLEAMPDEPYKSHLGDRAPAHNYVACKLAKKLMTIDGGGGEKPDVWRFLLNSWLAHLVYAAYNCREEYHTQQLRRGGEFLTHVWMLMVHLGLTDHFEKI